MNIRIIIAAAALCAVASQASAKEKIYVNSDVTTHIVMPENIKMVDLSTAKIIGNQCADNIVRVKPFMESDSLPSGYREGELMGTLTLIGERHLAQYEVVYTSVPSRAASIHRVPYSGMDSYINPEVSMPQSEMARYAWAVYGSGRRYNQVVSKAHGMKAIVNNIYSVDDYFFIDYSLQNRKKIPYIISEMRGKLTVKKEVQASNSRTVELTRADTPRPGPTFKRN